MLKRKHIPKLLSNVCLFFNIVQGKPISVCRKNILDISLIYASYMYGMNNYKIMSKHVLCSDKSHYVYM